MRTLLLVALVACSSSGKRDDAPTTVTNAPAPSPAKPAGPQSKVYLETPHGEIAVDVEPAALPETTPAAATEPAPLH